MLEYIPQDSMENVWDQIRGALDLANQKTSQVRLTYDGIILDVNPSDDPNAAEKLLARFSEIQAQQWNKAANTPESIAELHREQEERQTRKRREQEAQRNDRDQKRVDSLVESLPNAIQSGEAAIVKWVSDFAKVGDNISLKYDKTAIAEKLRAAGYTADARIGDETTHSNPTALAERIVALAIECLQEGRPIHRTAHAFAEKYEQLQEGANPEKVWAVSLGGRGGRRLDQ